MIPLAEFSLSLSIFPSFSLLSRCDFRFRTANQPTTTRHDYRNGFNGLGTFIRSSERAATTGPAIRGTFSVASRKGESGRDSPDGISDVAIGASHESFMRQSFLVPRSPGYPRLPPASPPLPLFFSLSFSLSPFLFLSSVRHFQAVLFAALCRNPGEPDASSYQSAESVNRRGNVFQPGVTYSRYHRVYRRSDSRDPFLILPVYPLCLPPLVRLPRLARIAWIRPMRLGPILPSPRARSCGGIEI